MTREPFEQRKQPITVRMSSRDLGKIKSLARRLGVHDSDVIRFAVKAMLVELAPLHDPEVRGQKLLRVFIESGRALFRHFELDAPRLDAIINEGVPSDRRVARDDLELLAVESLRRVFPRAEEPEPPPATELGGTSGSLRGGSLRDYLYEKYLHRGS